MNEFNKDILLGLMFISGIWGFISGMFVISTVVFASAALFSTIAMKSKRNN